MADEMKVFEVRTISPSHAGTRLADYVHTAAEVLEDTASGLPGGTVRVFGCYEGEPGGPGRTHVVVSHDGAEVYDYTLARED